MRRRYLFLESPLSAVLNRYESFFRLFNDFQNYVNYFLINELVSEDYSKVLFFTHDEQLLSALGLPKDVSSYLEYRKWSMNIVRLRNQRLAHWAANVVVSPETNETPPNKKWDLDVRVHGDESL